MAPGLQPAAPGVTPSQGKLQPEAPAGPDLGTWFRTVRRSREAEEAAGTPGGMLGPGQGCRADASPDPDAELQGSVAADLLPRRPTWGQDTL